jgi:hypothetical protein
MVTMDGEHRNCDIDILVFVVDVIESTVAVSGSCLVNSVCNGNLPSELLAGVTQHFNLARFVTETVLPQTAHNLVHRFARWLVLVEQITSQKNHVNLSFLGQAHDLVESFPTVVTPDRVAFVVSDMIVRGDKDTNGIRRCWMLAG